MKKLLTILTMLVLSMDVVLLAQSVGKSYLGKPLGAVLTEFCKKHPEMKISFIYDELEDYKVKGELKSDDPMNELRALLAMNPVSLTIEDDEVFIEPRQKGKYKFVGRAINGLTGEPVKYATVLLQNPKDSATITYGITDDNGYFSIPCDRKNVQARFSSVGYSTLYIKTPAFNMGNVRMKMLDVKLGEITKTADSRYALNDKTVYIPTQREKKAAHGGTSLLRFMGIPSIQVNMIDNTITTLSGGGITVFIDYMKADATELEGLRPEDVKRVEVLDYPSDPRFEGVPHAVNFIMTKYEYGGYTKLMGDQNFDFEIGDYSLSSKFTKGKMTYDLYTGFDYYDSSKGGFESEKLYEFGEERIETHSGTLDSEYESNDAYLSGRIKYTSDKTVLSNQLAVRYSRVPENKSHTYETYTPADSYYTDGEKTQRLNSFSLVPSWRGNFQFFLPRNLSLVVTPNLTFSRNIRKTNIAEEEFVISRDVYEKAWGGSVGVTLSKKLGGHTLAFGINGEMADDRLNYLGDNPADIHYYDYAAGGRVSGSFRFGILRLQPSVRFYYKWTYFDGISYTQPLPGYFISGSLDFNSKNQLNFSTEMSNWTIGVSYRSPNLVVQNKLDAVQGNPALKCWLYNDAELSYSYFPVSWLSLSAFTSYKRHTKPMENLFIPTEIEGKEMMLRTYVKEGYYQIISEGVSAVARLFKNSLTLQGTLSVASHRKRGTNSFDRTTVNGNIYGVYYLKDFYLQGSYQFRRKNATQYMRIMDRPSSCFYSVGCFLKNWNIDLSVSNPFRSNYNQGYTLTEYSNYKILKRNFGTTYHRSFQLSVTYTFRYGKKVKEERIDRGSSGTSGIVQ